MEDTWGTRDLPVLEYLVEQLDDPNRYWVEAHAIPEALGISEKDMRSALSALASANPPYLDGTGVAESRHLLQISSVTERARREVGAWPTADRLVDRLVASLNDAAEAEPDEEKRSKIKQVASSLGGSLRELTVQVVGSAITHSAGM